MTTPVAFIIFNRPDTTARVFAAIRAYRPERLLVIADGPRTSRPGEEARCRETRAIVEQGVDWPCQVERCYSDANLGCKLRLASGIDWVFQQVEEAIILEDDCLPHPTFFPYCEELLARYRDDARVGMISGDQFLDNTFHSSYRFSKLTHIWGWASWRRAWRQYDLGMHDWPDLRGTDWLRSVCSGVDEAFFWRECFDHVHGRGLDSWDYQWTFACWRHHMLTILPSVNLVSNIGFNVDATHTTQHGSPQANLPTYPIKQPLIHPEAMLRDEAADEATWRLLFRGRLRARFRRFVFRQAQRFLTR